MCVLPRFRAIVILVSSFLLGFELVCSNCYSQVPQNFASVEILLKAEAGLVAGFDDDSDTKLVEITDAFIFVPPSPIIGARLTPAKRTGVNEWLKSQTLTRDGRKFAFNIEDKRIVPQNLIVSTRDTVSACLDGKNVIFIEMFSNSLPGNRYCGMSYTFPQAEPGPVRVYGPEWMRLERAHILITNHQAAVLTNELGIARFDSLPIGCDVPLRVFGSKVKEDIKTKLVFPTLETSVSGQPVFYAKDPGHYRHVIQIVRDTGND